MPIPIIAGGLYAVVTGIVAKFLTDSLLKFVAVKVLLFSLLTVTLPIILKNLVVWFFAQVQAIVEAHVDYEGISSAIITFTGVGAYIATHLMLADCFAILITAIVIRFVLNLIPFVG